jgi:hypothetical protein
MTKDQILQALHQVGMGRVRTPLQNELAEGLADMFVKVFAMQPDLPVEAKIAAVASVEVSQPVRRGPGRPKKAEES